jgi:hypothetical protein
VQELWARAAIGPLSGHAALGFGLLFHFTWIAIAVVTLGAQKAVGLPHKRGEPDLLLDVAGGSSGRA